MIKAILGGIALCIAFASSAQDSSVYHVQIPLSDQRFHSVFEATLFQKLYAGEEVDYLALFITADTAGTEADYQRISDQLAAFIADERSSGIQSKSPKKQVKKLYADVHGEYLDKYEVKNEFTSVFVDGRYNCVSGSALFAHVFSALNIPYTIEEFPTHVMLIAYPDGDQIAVETTDPADGTLVFTPKMKKEFADELRAQKMISETEYQEGPEAVFQKNYMINDQISFRELAGIQYSNNAIFQLEKNNFYDALNFALKSFKLYPSESTRSVAITAAASILENGNVKDTNRVRSLSVLTYFRGEEVIDDYFFGHLADIVNKVMLAEQDTVQFSKACRGIMARTTDTTFTQGIALFYNYEMGRLFTLKKDYKTGVSYLVKAYAIDSVNLQVSALTGGCITAWLEQCTLNDAVTKLDSLILDYPSLANHEDLRTARIEAYLRLFGINFFDGKGADAELYKARFEQLVNAQNYRKLGLNQELFTQAYKEGAFYYYKKRQYQKAQETLLAGLKIDPDNIQLSKLLADFR